MSLQDYIVYLASQIDESPLYIFDGKFGEKAPGMLDEFDISTFGCHFENDFYSILNKRPTFRWFVAGPARTGAPWHIDPGCTSVSIQKSVLEYKISNSCRHGMLC